MKSSATSTSIATFYLTHNKHYMKKQLQPIKLRVGRGKEAWAYIDQNGIDIYIENKDGSETLSAKLYEKQIKKYL